MSLSFDEPRSCRKDTVTKVGVAEIVVTGSSSMESLVVCSSLLRWQLKNGDSDVLWQSQEGDELAGGESFI